MSCGLGGPHRDDTLIVPMIQAVQNVLQTLPENGTWDDVLYQLYRRRKIEIGLQQAKTGQVIDHDVLFRELLGDEDSVDSSDAG